MSNNNIENCVTSVTHLTLLQRMRNTRQEVSIAKESCAVPVLIEVRPVKHHVPPSIREWISICLDEGHIQPSQPHVGKLEGWPIRPYFKSSLYTDFECWCLKANVSAYLIPSKELFYQGANVVFEPISDDKYQFPTLIACRENFSKLFKEA